MLLYKISTLNALSAELVLGPGAYNGGLTARKGCTETSVDNVQNRAGRVVRPAGSPKKTTQNREDPAPTGKTCINALNVIDLTGFLGLDELGATGVKRPTPLARMPP